MPKNLSGVAIKRRRIPVLAVESMSDLKNAPKTCERRTHCCAGSSGNVERESCGIDTVQEVQSVTGFRCCPTRFALDFTGRDLHP